MLSKQILPARFGVVDIARAQTRPAGASPGGDFSSGFGILSNVFASSCNSRGCIGRNSHNTFEAAAQEAIRLA